MRSLVAKIQKAVFPSAERRAPSAERRAEILSKQFPLKIFLDFFLEKILKIEKPMQIFSQKCLYA